MATKQLPPPIIEFMTADQVAAQWHISRTQLHDLVQSGRVPVRPIKIGRRLLFPTAEVRAHLAQLLADRDR